MRFCISAAEIAVVFMRGSLKDFVGSSKHGRGQCDVKRLCSLQVDDKLESRCSLKRQIGRLGPFGDACGIFGCAHEEWLGRRAIGKQTAGMRVPLSAVDWRQAVFLRQFDDPLAMRKDDRRGADMNASMRAADMRSKQCSTLVAVVAS